ncbi:MAG: hypothetical protein LBD70_07990 [Bifidobacteriaceae bacterium]|jgi:hypothetical protein|nr:hypothetical protein [Bifidobacteriaceae bacterium]
MTAGGRPRRAAAVLAIAWAAALALSGCFPGLGAAGQTVVEEFNAAAAAQAVEFAPPGSRADRALGALIRLEPAPGRSDVATADLVAAIGIVGARRAEWVGAGGTLHLTLEWPNHRAWAYWERNFEGDGIELARINGRFGPYDESFCQLPTLSEIDALAGANDFSRVAECNPELESLGLEDWDGSTGHRALGDLEHLSTISIRPWDSDAPVEHPVTDLALFGPLERLQSLTLCLADDGDENRALVLNRYPLADVVFLNRAGQPAPRWVGLADPAGG